MDINQIKNETIFRILAAGTVFIIFLALLFKIATPLIWIFSAFLLTVVLNPVLNWVAKKMPHKSRGLAIALTYILIFLIVGGLFVSLVPLVIAQSVGLIKALPGVYQNMLSSNPQIASFLNANVPQLGTQADAGQFASKWLSFMVDQSLKVFGSIAAGFTIFTVSIYMSLEGPTVIEKFYGLFRKERGQKVSETVSKMYNIVIKYIVANLATATLAGAGAAVMLWIFNVPYIAFLSILIIFLDLIPMIGVFVIGAILTTMGFIYGGFWPAIIMLIYSILYAQFEYSYLEPVIYGKATDISPLTIIIAVIIAGSLAGILGLFIAVPVAACIQVLVINYWRSRKTALQI